MLLSHHTVVYCVFVCLYVRLRISQRRKKIAAWNFACWFDYYPGWASPMAAALLLGWAIYRLLQQSTWLKNFRGEALWAVRIGGGGNIAQGRMMGFASCKPADALVRTFVYGETAVVAAIYVCCIVHWSGMLIDLLIVSRTLTFLTPVMMMMMITTCWVWGSSPKKNWLVLIACH